MKLLLLFLKTKFTYPYCFHFCFLCKYRKECFEDMFHDELPHPPADDFMNPPE